MSRSVLRGKNLPHLHSLLLPALVGCGCLTGCNLNGNGSGNGTATEGSKGLWVANGTNVVEYNPAQLDGGTAATAPHVSINSAVFGTPQAVAFDPNGNLWVVDVTATVNGASTPALLEFSAAQLAALTSDNAPEPVAILVSSSLKTPRQAVIDTLGNAWVTDPDSNDVAVFTAAQLAKTGTNSVAPVLLITSEQFNGPSGIAFDGSGNLWIANNGTPATAADAFGGGTTVAGFIAQNLPALPETGTSTADLIADATLIDTNSVTIQSPWAIAFDSSGNLWLSNSATSTIVGFPQASLVNGAPTPGATLSSATVSSSPTIDQPHGLCFDDAGNLAVVNEAGGATSFSISVFGANQLVTGTPTPSTFIVGTATTLNAPEGCAYGPTIS